MSGTSAKARNTLTRVEADAMVRAPSGATKDRETTVQQDVSNQAQGEVYAGTGANGRCSNICLGERVHPSLSVS